MSTYTQALRSAKLQHYAFCKLTTWAGKVVYESRAFPWYDTAHGFTADGELEVIEDFREAPAS